MAGMRAPTPWHLWPVGIFAVLFNAIGAFDFVMTMARGAAYMAGNGMTPAQIAQYEAMPGWMTIVWAVGVFGAFGASILVLLRRKAAFATFVVSLAAFLVSLCYDYVLTDDAAILGPQMAIASAIITMLLIAFNLYARRMSARGVLR